MKIVKFLCIFCFCIGFLKAEHVSIALNYKYQFEFAGYIIAKEKGFYKDVGLDVTLKEYTHTSLSSEVVDKKADFGVGNSSIIIDAYEGKEIILLSAIFQKSPAVFISRSKDNEFLSSYKVDPSLPLSINAMIFAKNTQGDQKIDIKNGFKYFLNNKTDHFISFASNTPYILNQNNQKYFIHDPNDEGFDFYHGILFTSKYLLENNPDLVRRFNLASLKGWRYALENINETARIIHEKYNTQNKTLDHFIYEAKILKELSDIDEHKFGRLDTEKIKEIKTALKLMHFDINFLKKENEFICDTSKQIILNEKEKMFLENSMITLLSNNKFPPFAYKTLAGEEMGIEIEFFKLINKKLANINYNISDVNRSLTAVNIMKEQKNSLKYNYSSYDNAPHLTKTQTIFSIRMALGTLKDKDFVTDLTALQGKKVAVYVKLSSVKALQERYPNIEFVFTNRQSEAIALVKDKKVYGLVMNLPALSHQITQRGSEFLKVSGVFDVEQEFRLVVNKDNKLLLQLLNKAISNISEEEKAMINSKYLFVKHEDKSYLYKIVLPIVGALIIFVLISVRLNLEVKKRKKNELKFEELANIDALTNIYNRRMITKLFNHEIKQSIEQNRTFSIVFFDIDDFKLINDTLGHEVGDKILIEIANLIRNNIRKSDHFGRYGGEEFLIILPYANKNTAKIVACNLKDRISQYDFGIDRSVTCSFGISEFESNDTLEGCLKRADEALYCVKKNGKNSVWIIDREASQ